MASILPNQIAEPGAGKFQLFVLDTKRMLPGVEDVLEQYFMSAMVEPQWCHTRRLRKKSFPIYQPIVVDRSVQIEYARLLGAF